MADFNLQDLGAVIGAIGSIFNRNQTPSYPTAPQPGYTTPTYTPDRTAWGGGGPHADQVRSVYQQVMGRQPSDFEIQTGADTIRHEGYQAFVAEIQRKAGRTPAAPPAPQYQQPVYQPPAPVYQPPQPVYQPPQPVYYPPQPVYQPPQPVYQPPQPVYYPPQAPAQPGYGTPLPMGPLPVFR